MKFHRIVFTLFLAWLCAAGFVFSQEKPLNKKDKSGEQKALTVRTNVMILDSAGKFADNLKPEDLKVYEDEIEQKATKLIRKDFFDVGIVLDRTGSMRSELNKVVGTASLLADNLRDKDQAFVSAFVSRDKISVNQDWTADRGLLKKAVNNIFVEGGQSAVLDAVYLSAEKLAAKKDDSRRRALILISDCEDSDSFYKIKDVLDLLKNNNLEVYILAFTHQLPGETAFGYKSPRMRAIEFAELFAFETGGAAFFPKASKQAEIVQAAKTIILELRSQYVVEYVSTNQKRGDRTRKLRVAIADGANGEKRAAFTRGEISIPKN